MQSKLNLHLMSKKDAFFQMITLFYNLSLQHLLKDRSYLQKKHLLN